jgi:glutamate-1-semialdehyde aminotransferase
LPATLGLPDSPGVPAALAKYAHLHHNDLEAVERIAQVPLAAILLEPVVGNGGFISTAGLHSGIASNC